MGSVFGSEEPVRLLFVGSDSQFVDSLAEPLQTQLHRPVDTVQVTSAEQAAMLSGNVPAVILVDMDLNDETVITEFSRRAPQATVLAFGSASTVSQTIQAMEAGAYDFLANPLTAEKIALRINATLTPRRLRNSRHHGAADQLSNQESIGFGGLVGSSTIMRQFCDQMARVAPSRAPVFLTGPAGSGKHLCAKTIHSHSTQSDGPFVSVNCSALPADQMEYELFGLAANEAGDPVDGGPGVVERANRGTLYLVNPHELDADLQAKILRFMQTGTIHRYGEDRPRNVEVRIICATESNPMDCVADGSLREDLFYRLFVLPLQIPALGGRGSDILDLARAFLATCAEEENKGFERYSAAAELTLTSFPWPGNVRQLQNVIRHAVVLHDGPEITEAMLPIAFGLIPDTLELAGKQTATESQGPDVVPFWQQERRIIEEAVERFDGNISRAAAALEISPSTIYRKRQSWPQAHAN